ncbi:MAG: hypothetical protein LBR74_08460 [Eubacterium sp.]|nr:hypothetical protein [Eubacterium sp.]
MLFSDKNLLTHGSSEPTIGNEKHEQKYTMHQFKHICTNNHPTEPHLL